MYIVIGFIACFALLIVFAYYLVKTPKFVLAEVDPQRENCKSPPQRWLYDSLKMRGYVVATNLPCGQYEIALALPHRHIALLYDWHPDMSLAEKVHHKQKERDLKQHGWRTVIIRPQAIYTDFSKQLRKIEFYAAQDDIYKSNP